MENQEKAVGNTLETNAALYPGTIAEKSGEYAVDRIKASRLLRIVDALEEQV